MGDFSYFQSKRREQTNKNQSVGLTVHDTRKLYDSNCRAYKRGCIGTQSHGLSFTFPKTARGSNSRRGHVTTGWLSLKYLLARPWWELRDPRPTPYTSCSLPLRLTCKGNTASIFCLCCSFWSMSTSSDPKRSPLWCTCGRPYF